MNRTFLCNQQDTVVQTRAGLLRGFAYQGLYRFYGVKYAEAGRFQRPAEAAPWDGVRDALGYGTVCPMLSDPVPGAGELRVPHRYWPVNEDCLYLNVWTPALDPDAKKPVMVWLHGGGFSEGSSIEQLAYDGGNLSRDGDVVVVTLNHRLNILGYLDLSPYGEKYANSANAGMEDIVVALRWVRDNIAAFGGDPDNVTLFGQSGGGAKINVLMQMPMAFGLFHRGIIESGILDCIGQNGCFTNLGLGYAEHLDSRPVVEALTAELQLRSAEELETVPYPQLAAAYNKVAPGLLAQGCYVGNSPMPNDYYLGGPLEVGFTEFAKKTPIIAGSVMNEFKGFVPTSNARIEQDARSVIAEVYGEKNADAMIALFQKAFPGKSLRDLADMDDIFRRPTVAWLKLRCETCSAPSYSYMWTPDFDIDGGNGAWHCSEIPYVFRNTDTTPYAHITGGEQLEDQISGAWLSFARTGDPNHKGLPSWPVCRVGDEACMIFDTVCQLRHNHDHALLEAYAACVGGGEIDMSKIEH